MKATYYSNFIVNTEYIIKWLIKKDISQRKISLNYGKSIQRFHYLIHAKRHPLTLRAYERLCSTLKKYDVKDVKPFFTKYKSKLEVEK